MKTLVYSFGFAGLLFSCGSATDETTTENKDSLSTEVVVVEEPEVVNSFIIETGTLGIFKIGQPIPKLPEGLSSRKSAQMVNENGEDVEHVMYVIFNSLEDVAEITLARNDSQHEEDLVVIEMRAVSNYYESRDGIKVGTTLSELTEKYPDSKIWYNGESGNIVAETPAFGNTYFIINPASCTKKPKGNKDIRLTKSNFDETAKIDRIKIF